MSEVCAKHVKTPAFIYGACIGCELEGLRAEAQALREEVAALRARVVVLPERITPFPENIDKLDPVRCGWNACLDELARLNGKTVSEGLLRRISDLFPADMGDDGSGRAGWFPHVRATVAELRALLSEQEGGRQ